MSARGASLSQQVERDAAFQIAHVCIFIAAEPLNSWMGRAPRLTENSAQHPKSRGAQTDLSASIRV